MKYRLGLVLLFLSATIFSQSKDTIFHSRDTGKVAAIPLKDTTTQTKITNTPAKAPDAQIKETKCHIELAGKIGLSSDSSSIEEILADPVIRTTGCNNMTITSFEMVTIINKNFYQTVSTNDHLTSQMLHLVKQAMQGTPIIIQAVHYKLSDGKTGVMPGINLSIEK